MDHGLSENGSLNIYHLLLFCSFNPSYEVSKNQLRSSNRIWYKMAEPNVISAPVIVERIDRSGPWLPPDTGSSYSYTTQNLTDAP